ncbi:MAG: SufB/SufD family protein [Longibaculum sp.]
MSKYVLNSEFYLVIENGMCSSSHLPIGVDYQEGVLNFTNQTPVEVQVVYVLEQSMNMTINVEKNRNVQLIETKVLKHQAKLHKTMHLKENAIVHVFSESAYDHQDLVECIDDVYLQKDAICQCGYAELSEGSFEGSYHYYLNGEGASAKVRMAILSQKQERKHYEVLIQHNQPHTYGQMDNYGVVKDEGHLVIDGIGTITKGQHGSSSHQTNKIMVFDPRCLASANPYLYIDEYDVKASHAAGVGKMDEEHLYYLQSRGLTKKQAMQLITYGYLQPVSDVIDNQMLKERFEDALAKVGA